ncbi:MAG: sulfite exporter TauE/SafE family protein [Candidatus Eiseniibacteriota bacterium]|jgi:uncharacterized membrane protein YfcA
MTTPLLTLTPDGWAMHLLLVAGGALAGFVNTLGGGGSFLTLPLLVLAGLDASTANGTNRVAVLIQSAVASLEFGRHGKLPPVRTLPLLVAPTLVGALVGARIAVEIPEPMLRLVIGLVLLAAIPTVLAPEGRGRRGDGQHGLSGVAAGRRARIMLLLFGCGIYGGFLQAGVGILLLAVLVPLVGLDLVHANAVKVLLVAVFTALAIPVFASAGQVDLIAGLVLAIGNVAGALAATRLAVRGGARVVRWVVAAALILAAAGLLDLPERLGLGG